MKKRSRSKRPQPGPVADSLGSPEWLYVRDRPHPLLGPPPAIVETVLFSRVGHTFKKLPPFFGSTLYLVQDFLLDQTGASGADGAMASSKAFDLTTAVNYRFNVFPKDRTKRIKVAPPPTGPLHFSLNVGRKFVNAASDYADQYPANTYFVNLLGPAPALAYNWFFIGHNTNHWIQFQVTADLLTPLEFFGFTTFGVYPPRTFDPGLKSYAPFSTGLPLNLPGPNAVPYLMFAYTTPDPVDPGPCVFLG